MIILYFFRIFFILYTIRLYYYYKEEWLSNKDFEDDLNFKNVFKISIYLTSFISWFICQW